MPCTNQAPNAHTRARIQKHNEKITATHQNIDFVRTCTTQTGKQKSWVANISCTRSAVLHVHVNIEASHRMPPGPSRVS